MGPIVFWNRAEKREETEQVYGDAGIKFLYGTLPGQKLADWNPLHQGREPALRRLPGRAAQPGQDRAVYRQVQDPDG